MKNINLSPGRLALYAPVGSNRDRSGLGTKKSLLVRILMRKGEVTTCVPADGIPVLPGHFIFECNIEDLSPCSAPLEDHPNRDAIIGIDDGYLPLAWAEKRLREILENEIENLQNELSCRTKNALPFASNVIVKTEPMDASSFGLTFWFDLPKNFFSLPSEMSDLEIVEWFEGEGEDVFISEANKVLDLISGEDSFVDWDFKILPEKFRFHASTYLNASLF